jgi:hypothetical protein
VRSCCARGSKYESAYVGRYGIRRVPRLLWALFPPHGRWAKAAIIHDYLYANGIGSKAYADRTFLEAMEVLGVAWTVRTLMYWAVRLGGRGAYRRQQPGIGHTDIYVANLRRGGKLRVVEKVRPLIIAHNSLDHRSRDVRS